MGLDLKGGMSVTLEVSIPDLIISLSDYSDNEDFRSALSAARKAQNNSSDGFMALFDDAWKAQVAGAENPTELWRIFHNMEQKDLFPATGLLEVVSILQLIK